MVNIICAHLRSSGITVVTRNTGSNALTMEAMIDCFTLVGRFVQWYVTGFLIQMAGHLISDTMCKIISYPYDLCHPQSGEQFESRLGIIVLCAVISSEMAL